jgi:hypothetical protein
MTAYREEQAMGHELVYGVYGNTDSAGEPDAGLSFCHASGLLTGLYNGT